MNTADLIQLAAPGVRSLQPYRPGKPISELEREYGVRDIIKLASNENPLGPSPKALAAMADEVADLALYPDANGYLLKQRLAAHLNLPASRITLGNGSNDVLVLLAETFLTPNAEAVFSEYCFAVYPIATQAAGGRAVVVPALPADHAMPLGHDLEAIHRHISDATRIVFIANPNNPTGTWVPTPALKDFVAGIPPSVLVVIDEAYFEYTDPGQAADAVRWLDEFPNLVVTRTFSKAYGLAGLRIGYALSSPEIADLLNRVRQPFNVNSLALAAAQAALDDVEFIEHSRAVNAGGLAQLQAAFDTLGVSHIPSAGNFVLADMGRPALPVYETLLRSGIIVRPVDNYGLPNHLRITVGTEEQNGSLVDSLREILG